MVIHFREPYQIDNDLVDDFLINLKSLINFQQVQNPSRYDEILLALNNTGYDIDDAMKMVKYFKIFIRCIHT